MPPTVSTSTTAFLDFRGVGTVVIDVLLHRGQFQGVGRRSAWRPERSARWRSMPPQPRRRKALCGKEFGAWRPFLFRSAGGWPAIGIANRCQAKRVRSSAADFIRWHGPWQPEFACGIERSITDNRQLRLRIASPDCQPIAVRKSLPEQDLRTAGRLRADLEKATRPFDRQRGTLKIECFA